jgi:hypothetical protein
VPLPQITSSGTYQAGTWVYFEIWYTDPGQDAAGFGFTGRSGSRWIEGTYPFSAPNGGIIGVDSVAYPVNLECGTPRQHKAEVKAWIYDNAGAASLPVAIHISCKS